ncbi:MAG: sugar ABC transporter substrate-binding protein [Christensenellales bacterium]|jgi:ABC-type sugar transport system substrate-binding protein
MKRMISLLLVVLLVAFGVAGCGGQPEPAPAAPTPSAAQPGGASPSQAAPAEKSKDVSDYASTTALKGKKVGFINANADDLYALYYNQLKKCVELAGGEVVYALSDNNDQKELDNCNDMINAGVDAIVLITVGAATGAQTCKLAKEAGIPIFLCGQGVDGEDFTCWIRVDQYDTAYTIGSAMAKQYGDLKTYIVDGKLATTGAQLFHAGFVDAYKDAGYEEPESVGDGGWSKPGGLQVAQDLIASGREFEALFVANEEMVDGVLQALDEANITGIHIFSINGKEVAMQWIKDGKMTASISNAGTLTSDLIAQTLLIYFGEGGNGPEDVPQEIAWISSVVLTKENADTAIPWSIDSYWQLRDAGTIEYNVFNYIAAMEERAK